MLPKSGILDRDSRADSQLGTKHLLHGKLLNSHRSNSEADSTSKYFRKPMKRRRYGADPLCISNAESDEQHNNERMSCHGSTSYMALAQSVNKIDSPLGSTPEDRARATTDARPIEEVFSEQAPEVLDFQSYLLNQKHCATHPVAQVARPEPTAPPFSMCEHSVYANPLEEISEEEILQNRLSVDEIQKLPHGKFVKYKPGNPSEVLYIKNLSKEVTETDLVGLFLRFQKAQEQPLLFRLMKQGRMKGQAFVTFSDKETSSKALGLFNGYMLKGKPMIIDFGQQQGIKER